MQFEGNEYPNCWTNEELQRRASRSRGYSAAYSGKPLDSSADQDWRDGWYSATLLGVDYGAFVEREAVRDEKKRRYKEQIDGGLFD